MYYTCTVYGQLTNTSLALNTLLHPELLLLYDASWQELLLGENRIAELDMALLASYTALVLLELRGNALTQ